MEVLKKALEEDGLHATQVRDGAWDGGRSRRERGHKEVARRRYASWESFGHRTSGVPKGGQQPVPPPPSSGGPSPRGRVLLESPPLAGPQTRA